LLLSESDVVTTATSDSGKQSDKRRISDAEARTIAAKANKKRRSDVSVVLVRDVRDENFGVDDTNACYVPNTQTIFIDDHTDSDIQTLAHELVHWLLELNGNADPFPGPKKSHRRGKRFLMHESEDGTRIGRVVADIVNASGTTRRGEK
jgi:hypothetical protein